MIYGELYLHWSAHLDSSTVCLSAPESRRTLCDLLPVLLSGWRTAAGFPCSPEGGWVCSDTGSSSQSSSHHTVQATAAWACWHLQHQTGGQRRENSPAKKEGKKAFIYIYIFVTEGHMTSCSDQFFVVVFFPHNKKNDTWKIAISPQMCSNSEGCCRSPIVQINADLKWGIMDSPYIVWGCMDTFVKRYSSNCPCDPDRD